MNPRLNEATPPYAATPASLYMKTPLINRAQRYPLLLCLLSAAHHAEAQFVEISAEIDLISYRSDQPNAEAAAKPRTISVLCITGTNNWRIENNSSLNAANKWLFDGTNVYESLQITKPLPPERQELMKQAGMPAIAPFEIARSNLTINVWPSSDGQPLGDVGVNIPWLAFCSGTYLKREGRLIPLPCDHLRHTPDRYAYSDRTEIFHDAFGLPRSIELFLSKSNYLFSVEDFYKGWGIRYLEGMKRAVTNLQEGALTFRYSVTATTNFLSWTFPARFEFYQQGRDFIQNGAWVKRGVGTLKSIRETSAPNQIFDQSMHQTVVDWRFRDGETGMDANIYQWNYSFVPETSAPALQEAFQTRVEQARRHKEIGK